MQKPFSQACANNCAPIFSVLETLLIDKHQLLEIGSGTGQHAVYFAEHLPHVQWQTSDLAVNHDGINAWIKAYSGSNVQSPIELDVVNTDWGIQADAVFSANTAHIMSWPVAQQMLVGVGNLLPTGGIFALYGPFNYNGEFTSASNAQFDVWLKQQQAHQGIRHIEDVIATAESAGLVLDADHEMPANNRLLVFRKA